MPSEFAPISGSIPSPPSPSPAGSAPTGGRPNAPTWTSNAALPPIPPDTAADLHRKWAIEQGRGKLADLARDPGADELVAALRARRGGFFERLAAMFRGQLSGVAVTREVALTAYGFYYIAESANYAMLVPMPDKLLASSTFIRDVSAGLATAVAELRRTGTLDVRKDFKDGTTP